MRTIYVNYMRKSFLKRPWFMALVVALVASWSVQQAAALVMAGPCAGAVDMTASASSDQGENVTAMDDQAQATPCMGLGLKCTSMLGCLVLSGLTQSGFTVRLVHDAGVRYLAWSNDFSGTLPEPELSPPIV